MRRSIDLGQLRGHECIRGAKGSTVYSILAIGVLALASIAQGGSAPECLSNNGQILPINNAQVLAWKTSTKNQFEARAHVVGKICRIFADQTGHAHFGVSLDGSTNQDGSSIEVIYQEEMGALPQLGIGMTVEACGDYITANAGSSLPSPEGALVHWVHKSDDTRKHPDGFVVIQGQIYGDNISGAERSDQQGGSRSNPGRQPAPVRNPEPSRKPEPKPGKPHGH